MLELAIGVVLACVGGLTLLPRVSAWVTSGIFRIEWVVPRGWPNREAVYRRWQRLARVFIPAAFLVVGLAMILGGIGEIV